VNRRQALNAGAALASSAAAAQQQPARSLVELRYFYLRNMPENQAKRVTDLLSDVYIPSVKKAGMKTVGVFRSMVGPQTPYLLMLLGYDSFAALDSISTAVEGDPAYQKGAAKFAELQGLSYIRMERQLLRAFETVPQIEVTKPNATPRVFELRTYESNTRTSLKKKIGMFDNGEIAIFRKTGLQPVFFGDMLFGANLPNLTYMLSYDSLAAREKNWAAFVSHPEWLKLRATPGLSDAEVVSNISNSFLSPLPFSDIR
jgi:hypothetical protein